MVVHIYKVDGCEAPKFPRKTRSEERDAHAFANGVDKSFYTTVAGLFTSIGGLLLDVLFKEILVDWFSEVFTSAIRAKNCRLLASTRNGPLYSREEGVFGLVQLNDNIPRFCYGKNGNVPIASQRQVISTHVHGVYMPNAFRV
jgi:hypothetical protein